MRITNIGSDYCRVDEDNIDKFLNIDRIHIIEFMFFKPTERKIKQVLQLYPKTNRYVISNEIRTYNYILKNTAKKYYVMNIPGAQLITFFKKNNKVLLNFNNLTLFEKQFLLIDENFDDLLRNTEVVMLDQDIFEDKKSYLQNWSGNVIINNGSII